MRLTRTEAQRKLLHMSAGLFALLLRFMTWRQAALMAIAAFFFNWQALPRLGGRGLWREADHGRGFSLGILLYPPAVLAPVLAFHAEPARLLQDPDVGLRLLLGLAVNGVVAVAARFASLLDTAGAVSTVIIGTAITVGLGLAGLLVMAAFFVLGSAATRLGYARKAALGIAQEEGGARGWRSAWANGGVPALLALLAATAPPELGAVYTLAYAAAVATAAADTCASDVGKARAGATVLL